MSTTKFRIALAALLTLVPIVCNIQLDKAAANPTSQESDAELDRRKAQEVFNKKDVIWRRKIGITQISSDWQKTVDAAGLHTLLSKNKQPYTLLAFNFQLDMQTEDIKKLFAPENQADLQRILKCNIIPFTLSKANVPNGSTVVLKTMEDSCTVQVRGRFIDELRPEIKQTATVSNGTSCSTEGSIGGLPITRCSETTRPIYKETGRMIKFRSNTIWIDGVAIRNPDEEPSGNNTYIEYRTNKMKFPPDLQLKYGKYGN
jgi:hypothetical protein